MHDVTERHIFTRCSVANRVELVVQTVTYPVNKRGRNYAKATSDTYAIELTDRELRDLIDSLLDAYATSCYAAGLEEISNPLDASSVSDHDPGDVP